MNRIFYLAMFSFAACMGNQEVFRVALESQTVLSEKDVKCIQLLQNAVNFELTPNGSEILEKTTANNIGKKMEITICGKENSPAIMQSITSPFIAPVDSNQVECLEKSSLVKCK